MLHLSRPVTPTGGGVVEVACDESGAEGEHLAGATTDVFAHATVAVPPGPAALALAEIRDLIGSPAQEYKANHLLRRKHREVLRWFLGPTGPVTGVARVHLVEKEYFLLRRLCWFLLGDAAPARSVYRSGVRGAAPPRWREFLGAANDLMRTRAVEGPGDPVAVFYRALAALDPGQAPVLDRLARTRARAERRRPELVGDVASIPVLDPLFPAVERAVHLWGSPDRPVVLVHDRQRSLSPDRVVTLAAGLGGRLAGIHQVDSATDPRVQLADFLAGVARWIASEELGGRGEPDLTESLTAYVDPASIWADRVSWSRLSTGAIAG
ncbi:DUF3800 domain-containing protein [Ornithinicoccus hortensis]|uniref:NAD-dependent protein deacetylase of SIR2 family n=1 Tax=Ornithinicoccus hortensis TaxID=82346 RepID=A0A542YSF4_9MICO|nr:DUF3800 domain-containing protein [Ornithinicoccus hortensis]TQL51008.1 hypothetical protein FB467_2141 [Ornithinicoccus hortensis]